MQQIPPRSVEGATRKRDKDDADDRENVGNVQQLCAFLRVTWSWLRIVTHLVVVTRSFRNRRPMSLVV